jgi:hypothetical protein
VADDTEEMVASDELALGPEVHGASSSGVLRGEGKVGPSSPVWTTMGWSGKGWRGRARMAAKE